MILAGLDIETTGLDPYKHHRIIQIGVAINREDAKFRYTCDIFPEGQMVIDPDAMKINGFTTSRIYHAASTTEVDEDLATLLGGHYKPGELTPVGWNVGGFDMGFIKKEMPETAQYFAYRTLDLTGVAMMHELRTGKPYRDLKVEMAAKIAEILGRDQRHDALYDAEAALVAVDLFKELHGA